ncbi:MAG: hypothetical protein JST54_35395 [Deltaproteobacteria bacterium]|nr:hypothetical protein [Deltaproteobacteria bacterium]
MRALVILLAVNALALEARGQTDSNHPGARLNVFAATPYKLEGVHVELRCERWLDGAREQGPLERLTNDEGRIILPLDVSADGHVSWGGCVVVEGQIVERELVGGPVQVDLGEGSEIDRGARPVYAVDYDLALDAEPGARMKVRVLGEDGSPLDGKISYPLDGKAVRTVRVVKGDADLGVRSSTRALHIEAPGYVPRDVGVHVVPGEAQTIEVRLFRAPDHGGDRVVLKMLGSDSHVQAAAVLGPDERRDAPTPTAPGHDAQLDGVVAGPDVEKLAEHLRVVARCGEVLYWGAVEPDGHFNIPDLPAGPCVIAVAREKLNRALKPEIVLEARTSTVAPATLRLELAKTK